ncbi:hypothetical protein J2T22_004223 [Pseudarthrobacter defluvii]|uniref:Uncharacterized protein n=1 Tax=Pseudarthrobacter defluvii TaxID=410837 RepID=A0ABT9UMY7_9MICC|nr:hypothetical protein [Pseudarthrobacter defluvii]MDQ0121010.1 hypothetical protein [Pseudarthrobacter defluvii]
MTHTTTSRATTIRAWLLWTASFLALPLGGYAGTMISGRINDPLSAVLGGATAGIIIGGGQALTNSHRLRPARWILATVLGMSAGLALGAAAVGYRTSLPDLALMGALNGLVLGFAQAVALPEQVGRRRWIWAAAMPALWSLGWTVTTLAGIAVDQQFIVFGASGALLVTAITGLILNRLLPVPLSNKPAFSPTIAEVQP